MITVKTEPISPTVKTALGEFPRVGGRQKIMAEGDELEELYGSRRRHIGFIDPNGTISWIGAARDLPDEQLAIFAEQLRPKPEKAATHGPPRRRKKASDEDE